MIPKVVLFSLIITLGMHTQSFAMVSDPNDEAFNALVEDAQSVGKEYAKDDDSELRLPAMKEAAIAYGIRGGLAFGTKDIAGYLEEQAGDLSQTFSFNGLMLDGKQGTIIIPPVISKAHDAWELARTDEKLRPANGKILRLTDGMYHIVSPARFASRAPIWRDYLLRSYKKPELPDPSMLPRDGSEEKLWKTWVRQGWDKGIEQSVAVFQSDMRRLKRDLTGMHTYHTLVSQKMISEPVVQLASHGITGDKNTMRVNDRILRITGDAALNLDQEDWVIVPLVNKTVRRHTK